MADGEVLIILESFAPIRAKKCNAFLGKIPTFSLYAGVAANKHQRKKLERLCRYITRPAVSTKRPSLTDQGKIRYELKTAYDNGTTHIIFDPLDFISRLAALVPKPRVNLTRFHGVFAPNCKARSEITNNKKNKDLDKTKCDEDGPKTECERRAGMTWAQRLKRVFNIDITVCSACGGAVKIIACIEEQSAIDKILNHLKTKESSDNKVCLLEARAPPQGELFH